MHVWCTTSSKDTEKEWYILNDKCAENGLKHQAAAFGKRYKGETYPESAKDTAVWEKHESEGFEESISPGRRGTQPTQAISATL